jgi:hypothetical protein
MGSPDSGESDGVDPQFQMFDESPNENEIASVPYDRLFRGRFLFRSQGRECRTTDLFIEATYEEVLERATNFEEHLLADLLRSLL